MKTETGFQLLDWRQEFGGELRYGDIYYELAKLLHGLVGYFASKASCTFRVTNPVRFQLDPRTDYAECEDYLCQFVKAVGLSWDKVVLITSLIFLNIAGLHTYPRAHFYYYLGKFRLGEATSALREMNVERY